MRTLSPVIDIVIVNYKSAQCLRECIRSVNAVLGRIKANIFVENNSPQEEIDIPGDGSFEISICNNASNLGFAKAVNKALRKGSAPYVLVLNPDTLLLEGFFDSVLAYMENNADIGVVGPKILNPDGSVQGSARSFPTPLTALFGRSSLLTKWFPRNKLTRRNVLTMASDGVRPMEVDWVSGACMLVRRRAIEDVGLLDERFFMYWEDADWCRRMWEKRWKVVYYPTATIIHYTGASSHQHLFKAIYEFHKSSYLLFNKYNQNASGFVRLAAVGALAARFAVVAGTSIVRAATAKALASSRARAENKGKNEKIKVLRVISRLNIGGPAIHVALLTKSMNSKRFQNFVVTGTPSPHEGDMRYLFEDCSSRIFVLPTLHRDIDLITDFKTIISLYRLMRKIRPHIVDSHTAKAGFATRIAASLLRLFSRNGPLTVHTFHGNVFKGYFKPSKTLAYIWIERALATITDTVIAISPAQKEELVHTYKIASDEKVKIVPLGLELDRFLTCGNLKGKFRRRFSMDKDCFLVGIVGRLVPIKNHMMFLKAAKAFVVRHPETSIGFAVIGDGELRDELKSLTRKMGLREKVTFCGWIKDIQAVYADLDALVLTSINEGTPVSIIEAMASRVPIISTCVGGVRDLIGSPKGPIESGGFAVCSRGILCKSGDFLGLARALEYLLNEDEEEKEKRLVAAMEFVRQRYSKARLLSDMESLYTNLLNKACC